MLTSCFQPCYGKHVLRGYAPFLFSAFCRCPQDSQLLFLKGCSMDTVLVYCYFQRPKTFLLVFAYLLSAAGLILTLSSCGTTALAASATPHSSGQHFSLQARIGFHAGD